MMTKQDMVDLFANMKENAPWDISKPLLWGYFFADPNKATLEQATPVLVSQGYRVAGIYDSEPDGETPALWWLHVEKVEKHTADSLHERNQLLYQFAADQGIDSYDGMDVGPASN